MGVSQCTPETLWLTEGTSFSPPTAPSRTRDGGKIQSINNPAVTRDPRRLSESRKSWGVGRQEEEAICPWASVYHLRPSEQFPSKVKMAAVRDGLVRGPEESRLRRQRGFVHVHSLRGAASVALRPAQVQEVPAGTP